MLALERRRLENRSREEGPGSARDETVGVAETPSRMVRVKRPLGQAALFSFAEYPVAWPIPPKQLRRQGCGELHSCALVSRNQIDSRNYMNQLAVTRCDMLGSMT